MRISSLLLLLSIVVIGCTKEIEEHQPSVEHDTQAPARLDTEQDEHQWAAELISGAADWEPVTATAVPAHRMNWGLCRAPIPGVDDHGPHGANLLSTLNLEHPQDKPIDPANQFIVNPIGRDYFYVVPKPLDKVAAVSPPLPVGTVIIKEKYNQIEDAKARVNPKAFGVMIKHEPGYDPEHGDWEYAYIELNKPNTITAATRGRLANCIDCHANRKQTDYLFRNYPLQQRDHAAN